MDCLSRNSLRPGPIAKINRDWPLIIGWVRTFKSFTVYQSTRNRFEDFFVPLTSDATMQNICDVFSEWKRWSLPGFKS
jgi:hypothetical protein